MHSFENSIRKSINPESKFTHYMKSVKSGPKIKKTVTQQVCKTCKKLSYEVTRPQTASKLLCTYFISYSHFLNKNRTAFVYPTAKIQSNIYLQVCHVYGSASQVLLTSHEGKVAQQQHILMTSLEAADPKVILAHILQKMNMYLCIQRMFIINC